MKKNNEKVNSKCYVISRHGVDSKLLWFWDRIWIANNKNITKITVARINLILHPLEMDWVFIIMWKSTQLVQFLLKFTFKNAWINSNSHAPIHSEKYNKQPHIYNKLTIMASN